MTLEHHYNLRVSNMRKLIANGVNLLTPLEAARIKARAEAALQATRSSLSSVGISEKEMWEDTPFCRLSRIAMLSRQIHERVTVLSESKPMTHGDRCRIVRRYREGNRARSMSYT